MFVNFKKNKVLASETKTERSKGTHITLEISGCILTLSLFSLISVLICFITNPCAEWQGETYLPSLVFSFVPSDLSNMPSIFGKYHSTHWKKCSAVSFITVSSIAKCLMKLSLRNELGKGLTKGLCVQIKIHNGLRQWTDYLETTGMCHRTTEICSLIPVVVQLGH